MRSRLAFAVAVFAIAAGIAYGQQAAQFIGPITPGNCAQWNTPGILKDAGVNCASGGGGTGTVTSVALSLPNLVFSISGSPVTNNGTLTGSYQNQAGHTALMGANSGASGPPAFRAISSADLPLPTSVTPGVVLTGGPVTSSYVFAVTTSGGVLLRQPSFGELSGSATPSQCPAATTTTQGCVQTAAPIASNWINGYAGNVPQLSRPQFTDIGGSVAFTQFPLIGNNTVLSNITGSTNVPAANGISPLFDSALGSASGSIIYRTTSGWVTLPPGITGQVLATSGSANPPAWIVAAGSGTVQTISPGSSMFFSTTPCTVSCVVSVVSTANNTVFANVSGGTAPPSATSPSALLDVFGSAQGDILTRGATIWNALAPGTSGQFLKTNGAAATPAWTTINQVGGGATLATATPGNPTNTASTSFVMGGFGGTCKITPTQSGRVQLIINGSYGNTVASDGVSVKLAFGTGTAPTANVPATGTVVGNQRDLGATNSNFFPLIVLGTVTGLSTGVAYWFDIQWQATTGGTASGKDIDCSAIEY